MELLANKIRPTKLDEIIGQNHLIGKGKILTNLIKNKKMFSLILYGNPGCGKTSIANAIVNELDIKYRFLNATVNSKKDFDVVIEEAKMYNEMILVIDEIHRMNKDKQDLLLPYIESGLIILIGLTTSNPYFSINSAIRSRCHIFEVKNLSIMDIYNGLKKITKENNIMIEDEAVKYISSLSQGDFRYAINLVELANTYKKNITIDVIKEINPKANLIADKNENGHYDVISAFQKSIRGSDIDASLHYLARLIEAGDIDIIFRRLLVITYEDIGLANPSMGPKVMAAINTVERIGIDEGKIALANVVIELASSPKSNSAYIAINEAINDIKKGNSGEVPNNIKTHSKNYLYPHDYPKYYVKQNYMPEKLKNKKYYYKKNNKYENNLNLINKEMKS